MRFILSILIWLCGSFSALAQNTQIPQEQSPAPTISLDIKLIQVVLNDEHRQGVDWEAIVSDYHGLPLKKDNNPVWVDKKYKLSVGLLSGDDFNVLLDALDTVGKISRNEDFSVSITKDDPQETWLTQEQKGWPAISLKAQWHNSSLGEPRIRLTPSFKLMLKESSQPNSPVILSNETQADFKDNTTVVMGGFMHEEEITKTHKFPLLGDLPVLGLVFRKQGRLMQKTETIIFITMHASLPSAPTQEKKP